MSARDDKAPLNIEIRWTVLRSPQPFSLLSLLPCVPPLFPLWLSFTSRNSPTPFPFSSSASSRQAFVLLCRSDTFLKHAEEREKQKGRGWKGGETKGGRRGSERARDKSAGHFLSYCWGEKDGKSWVSREIKGKQRVTEMERQPKEWRRQMQRETPLSLEIEHISLLIRCQLDLSHPHFLIFWQISGQILFTSFVHLNLSGFFFLSDKEHRWWVITTTASAQISQAAPKQRVLYLVWFWCVPNKHHFLCLIRKCWYLSSALQFKTN